MAPGCSPEPRSDTADLVARHGTILLGIALAAIERGVGRGSRLDVDLAGFAGELRQPRASFVTLHLGGELRGCIGKSRACQPLVADVAENAFAAALEDPRFPPVAGDEIAALDIEVSVLGASQPIGFADEADLLAQLRPGIDGVIIECADKRSLFLPDVWEALPEPADFLRHLKRKAGLDPDYWSPRLTAQRFTTAAAHASAARLAALAIA